jgi:hypothetical protein
MLREVETHMARKLTMIQVTAFHMCNIMKMKVFVATVKSSFQTIPTVLLHTAYSVPY